MTKIRKLATQQRAWRLACGVGLLMVPAIATAVLTDELSLANAQALSLGNAVTADPPGIDAVYFNPAGLTALKGKQLHVKFATAAFDVKLRFGEYDQTRQQSIQDKQNTGLYPDAFFEDSAHHVTSETEGAAVMIPGAGMTEMPVIISTQGGVSYSPPDSKFTFATSVYAPIAAGFYRDDDDPGRFIGKRFSMTVLTYFSPTVAYAINDTLSVGAAFTANYIGIGMDLPFRAGSDLISFEHYRECNANPGASECAETMHYLDELGMMEFEAEDHFSPGFNAGILWQFTDWLRLGLAYQSHIDAAMKGDFRWENSTAWQQFYAPAVTRLGVGALLGSENIRKGTANIDMKMPARYTLGASFQLNPRVKVNVDYKHSGWSSWDGITVQFTEPIDYLGLAALTNPTLASATSVTFPFTLKDTWNWAVGLEYRYSDPVYLRMGVEERPSSVTRASRSPMLPIDDGALFGMGVGYQMASGALLDVAIGYFWSDLHMSGGSSTLGNSNDQSETIYNPYPGTDIKASVDSYMFEMSYRVEF